MAIYISATYTQCSCTRSSNPLTDPLRSQEGSTDLNIAQLITEAKKAREKTLMTLEEFRDAKDLCSIDHILRNSKYPEDDESPSGKQFIPMLILRRCNLLLKTIVKMGSVDLFQKRYQLLLRDLDVIELTWLEHLPVSVHFNLFYLKTLCQIKLQQFADAKVSHDKAVEALEDDSYLDEKVLDKRKSKLDAGLKEIQKNGSANKTMARKLGSSPKLASANPAHPTFSKTLTVQAQMTDSSNKSCVFATEDILPGEVIAIEKPLVQMAHSALLDDCKTKELCHRCLQDTLCLSYPCSGCCLVVFCSLECRDLAIEGFHRHVCKMGVEYMSSQSYAFHVSMSLVLRFIFALDRHTWMLFVDECAALRKVILATNKKEESGIDGLKRSMSQLVMKEEDKESTNETVNPVLDPLHKELMLARKKISNCSKALPLFQLLELHSTVRYNGTTTFPITLASNHAWEIVKQSGMMDPITADMDAESLSFLVPAIAEVRWKCARQIRAISTDGFKEGLPGYFDQYRRVSSAIHKNVSMISHSCLPNAMCFDEDGMTVVVSVRAITKGEEITIPYIFEILEDEPVRRKPLSAIEVQCACVACTNGWGMREYGLEGLMKRPDIKKALSVWGSQDSTADGMQAVFEEYVRVSLCHSKTMSQESYAIWSNTFALVIATSLALTYKIG